MDLKTAYQIVFDLAGGNVRDESNVSNDPSVLDQREAFKVMGEFMDGHLTPKVEKPVPFFLTPTMEAVLNVLLSEPRCSYAKHEIAERCDPPMNDHAVSARISDLRKRGFDVQKTRAHGKAYYLYFMPRV